jgi:hypothetical protein
VVDERKVRRDYADNFCTIEEGILICASSDPRPWKRKTVSRLTAWQNWIFQRPNAEVAHHDTG